MAQRLHPVLIATPHFRQGNSLGVRYIYRGDIHLADQINEEQAVGIILNLVELALETGSLNEKLVRRDVGLLIGWIVSASGR
jgi:hypothetical protein